MVEEFDYSSLISSFAAKNTRRSKFQLDFLHFCNGKYFFGIYLLNFYFFVEVYFIILNFSL